MQDFFGYILRLVTARNALYDFVWVFSNSKNFKFTRSLGSLIFEFPQIY